MKIFKRIIPILFLLPALLLAGCSDKKTQTQGRSQAGPAAKPQVQVSPALADQPDYSLTLPGELMPYEQVEIFPKVKGFIKDLYVDRGSAVKKGQLLAVLEAPEISQQYLAARSQSEKLQASFLYSRQAFNRLRKAAANSGAVAALEIDKARAQVRSDSAAYAAAQAQTRVVAQLRSYLQIRAPFGGTIISRHVSAGALVGDNTGKAAALFTLAQNQHLRLTVAIPEKHAQALQPRTQASFTVSGRPGKIFNSVLTRNGLLVNQALRSITAEFDVNNEDKALNGGEYAQVKLKLRRPDATIWVPAASVVRAQSGVFLLKVENGLVQRVPVSEGLRRDTLQEVFGNLKAGDLVVKKGTEELAENTAVQVLAPGMAPKRQAALSGPE